MSAPPGTGGESRLRIGIEIRIADRQESGQQRYLWRLGRWLAVQGHELHFITVLPQKQAVDLPGGVVLHQLSNASRGELRRRIRDLHLDVLLLNPERSRRFRGLHANVLRPAYGTEHYRQKLRSFRTPLRSLARRTLRVMPWEALERRWERRFYEAPDPPPRVIAVSGYMRNEILDSYRIPPDHVHLIHNGVDLDEFSPARRAGLRTTERARWGIPPDAGCFLFMGHNYRLKGLWPLMDVVRRLRDEGANLHLLVAGRATGKGQRRRARRTIEAYGMEGAVHLAGPIRPAIRAFAAADAFIHLSWHDSFGFVTLEAMASGVPVLTTPFVGAAEVVEDGVSGWIVDPREPGAVVDRARRLLDAGARETMSRAAAAVGRAHPEEANFRRVRDVIRSAAAGNRGPVS
jgi:glycosyltransferase involved in cell wall biosynthesis